MMRWPWQKNTDNPAPSPDLLEDDQVMDPVFRQIVAALRAVEDPELKVNVYDLGLIYDVAVDEFSTAHVQMTLTSPNCPVAGSLPKQVAQSVARLPSIRQVRLELVWDPPWDRSRMSRAARWQVGL
ncbi:iron-sulfur cluster assembly protein [Magnetococcus sp. PR-3]|uniref:iron-sulfur cluster assembly protein n=1 Tax=Magnetococcus sp. PR-3 TaxID=3120355 RepID=UPI002FCDF192